jgi:hypothetical protein
MSFILDIQSVYFAGCPIDMFQELKKSFTLWLTSFPLQAERIPADS